jgi:hypothetical protein
VSEADLTKLQDAFAHQDGRVRVFVTSGKHFGASKVLEAPRGAIQAYAADILAAIQAKNPIGECLKTCPAVAPAP